MLPDMQVHVSGSMQMCVHELQMQEEIMKQDPDKALCSGSSEEEQRSFKAMAGISKFPRSTKGLICQG